MSHKKKQVLHCCCAPHVLESTHKLWLQQHRRMLDARHIKHFFHEFFNHKSIHTSLRPCGVFVVVQVHYVLYVAHRVVTEFWYDFLLFSREVQLFEVLPPLAYSNTIWTICLSLAERVNRKIRDEKSRRLHLIKIIIFFSLALKKVCTKSFNFGLRLAAKGRCQVPFRRGLPMTNFE